LVFAKSETKPFNVQKRQKGLGELCIRRSLFLREAGQNATPENRHSLQKSFSKLQLHNLAKANDRWRTR
jgi:hypothetical protein